MRRALREAVHTPAAAAAQGTWSARARCWMRARAWACAARAPARCTPPPAPPRCPAGRPLARPRFSSWSRTAPRRPTGAARGPGLGTPPCNRVRAAASGLCEGEGRLQECYVQIVSPRATLRSPPAMRGTDVKRAAGQGRPRAHRAALGGLERPVRGSGGAAGGGGRRGGRAGGGRRRRRRAWRSAPRSAAGDAGATSSRLAACGPRVWPTLTGSVSTASAYVVAASLAQTLGAALTSSEGTLYTLGTPPICRHETRRAPGGRPRRTSQQMRRSIWRAARAATMRPLYVPRMQASMQAPHARRTSRATRRCTWRRARAMRRPCARCWRARAARRPRWRAATAPASCRCTRQRARGRGRPRPHWRPPRRRPRRSPTGAA